MKEGLTNMELTAKQKTRKSIFLALILRHQPEKGNLTLDKHGWADVSKVLKALDITKEALQDIVATDEKGRYEFNETETKIRACQGHSVNVEIEFIHADPPEILYHGTVTKNLNYILKEGLLPMSRLYVHLSSDYDTAFKVGSRRQGNTIVLKVLAGEMKRKGYNFVRSSNGVWLIKAVPPEFLVVEYNYNKQGGIAPL